MIHNGTTTSIEAAESVRSTAATDRQRILDAIRAADIHGLTREEIELIQRRQIEEAGEVRPTKSGERARVLTVVAP